MEIVAKDTEVSSKARRRRFPGEYKRRILKEAEACSQRGEIGALLRREGLYSSHLSAWRVEAEAREVAALSPKKRGPKPKVVDERDQQIEILERRLAGQMARAERAEAVIEVQKKVAEILGIRLPPIDEKL
jgi:transposase